MGRLTNPLGRPRDFSSSENISIAVDEIRSLIRATNNREKLIHLRCSMNALRRAYRNYVSDEKRKAREETITVQ